MTNMNKYIYILFASLCTSLFISCSDDLTNVSEDEFIDPRLTRGYSDEQIKLQRLGYAYNAAGNVMDDSSFSVKPIINMSRLYAAEKANGPIVSSERRHYTSLDIFSGCTLEELGHEETKYTVNGGDVVGCGMYYRKNKTTYRGEWKSCYRAHMFIKHIMATHTIDAGMLHCLKLDDLSSEESVLDAEFRHELAELVKNGESGINEDNATKFSQKYGTHLVVSSNLGGMVELQMEINRDSCVDKVYATTQVAELILGEKVVNTSKPQLLGPISSQHSIQYHGKITVKGGSAATGEALHKTFDYTKAAEVKISDGDYYAWANSVSIEPANYNASFVSGRFLPLYELFEDLTTRQALRKVYELYLKKEAPMKEPYEPPYGQLAVKGNYGPDVRVVSLGDDKACIICQEYVPSIRSDKTCVVVYPLIKDDKDNFNPYFFSGLFVGDESHRPGRVLWDGAASLYIPSDSIFAESDSTAIRELFDKDTHMLKNVYIYWNNAHPQPCPSPKGELKTYTTSVYSLQPAGLAQSTNFAKVASTFWSVRPVVLENDSILKYWRNDSAFKEFNRSTYKDHDGVFYKYKEGDKEYNYCLMDGGDNFARAKEYTDDRYGHKRWIDAVSRSMNALNLKGYLPSVAQSKSITKMLGNRMSIFYGHEYDGRNMLGLDWPTGYSVIPFGQNETVDGPQHNDGQGLPIITDDAGQARIMRLSGSGTDLLLEYPEYVSAFNYSNQAYFKYFPIYITIRHF